MTYLTHRAEELEVIKPADSQWHIYYLRPRTEKIVYQNLVNMGFEAYLPTIKVLKLWKNRQKKWIEQALFPGYIFVNIPANKLYDVIKLPKVISFVSCGGVPSVISDKEISCIKRMLSLDADILVVNDLAIGQQVRVTHGPLLGCEGILVKKQGKSRFMLHLKDVNHSVSVDICENFLEAI